MRKKSNLYEDPFYRATKWLLAGVGGKISIAILIIISIALFQIHWALTAAVLVYAVITEIAAHLTFKKEKKDEHN